MDGNQIRELRNELEKQPETLERFAKSRLPRAPKGSIFIGAGDSYAAALAAFHASRGRCIALDPYNLAIAPEIAEGLEVFIISVSGRTTSNVVAAKRVMRLARRTTALTAVADSELASLADRVVRLPMAYVPRTVGMLSFSLSLLAVLGMTGVEVDCDFRAALKRAKEERGTISYGKGTSYFLGNSLAYPAALYAAAKTYEVLGAKAHAELLEEFSHLELFALKKSDAVNVFSCFDPSGMAVKLRKALTERGYESHVVPSRGKSDIERLFHSVFVAQLSVLEQAMKSGLSKPRFLLDSGRLRMSDAMIY